MKFRPLQPFRESIPLLAGSGKGENIPQSYANEPSATLSEAERIEAARRELLTRSDEVRLGVDPDPLTTTRALGKTAELLANSEAPEREIAMTLNMTHANLHAAGVESIAMRRIVRLAIVAIKKAYPEVSNTDENRLNSEERAARLGAVSRTSPEVSFPEAFEQEWTARNRPLDPLIDRTDELVKEADIRAEAARKEKVAKLAKERFDKERASSPNQYTEDPTEKTGVRFDPFAEDENRGAA